MVAKVTEVDRLIVGRHYRVQCVCVRNAFGRKASTWLPIHANDHSDSELDADFSHFHYDRRFLPPHLAKLISVNEVLPIRLDSSNVPADGIVWMERRCYAASVRFLPEQSLGFVKQQLEPLCRNMRMQPGGRCPHRGTPLNAVAPDENGVIHCPAHGLKWLATTGEMAPIDTAAK